MTDGPHVNTPSPLCRTFLHLNDQDSVAAKAESSGCGGVSSVHVQRHIHTSVDEKSTDILPQTDQEMEPILKTITMSDKKPEIFSEMVPGKGRPPEPPVDCCMSGCANCVWIKYADELKDYYCDGKERALQEIELMENESLKAFLKLELSLL